VSHSTEQVSLPSAAAVWVDAMLRSAYPRTTGITRAALEALAGQETFTAEQTAYLMAVMYEVGAHVRTAADAAEVEASRAANFEPAPTRSARIALRSAAMKEQAEIAWLRRTGSERPPDWPGGTAADAEAAYLWDDERPDHVPPDDVSVQVRKVWDATTRQQRYFWRDEA
jgi:phage tail protein X